MDSNNPVTEKSRLVIQAMIYANENNLDVNDLKDVKKILKALNVQNEDPQEFMNLLQHAEDFMDMSVPDNGHKKGLVN